MEDVSDLCTITNTLDEEHERCLRFMYNHKHSSDEEEDQFLSTIKIFKTLLRGQKHLSPRDSKIYFC